MVSSSTCPSQLATIDQPFNICTKLVNAQVGCVTNVDSYSVRDILTIVCYREVIFVAVTKLLRFLDKTTNIFAASGFHKIPRRPIIYCACARNYTLLENYTLPCSQFKHYVVGETGVSWDTFYFFSNISENIYDTDFVLTRQGRGILPLQTGLISYVVTSFVATVYSVNDTWSSCPNLPRHGVVWDSTRGT